MAVHNLADPSLLDDVDLDLDLKEFGISWGDYPSKANRPSSSRLSRRPDSRSTRCPSASAAPTPLPAPSWLLTPAQSSTAKRPQSAPGLGRCSGRATAGSAATRKRAPTAGAARPREVTINPRDHDVAAPVSPEDSEFATRFTDFAVGVVSGGALLEELMGQAEHYPVIEIGTERKVWAKTEQLDAPCLHKGYNFDLISLKSRKGTLQKLWDDAFKPGMNKYPVDLPTVPQHDKYCERDNVPKQYALGRAYCTQKLWQLFQDIDKDHNGYVTQFELVEALRERPSLLELFKLMMDKVQDKPTLPTERKVREEVYLVKRVMRSVETEQKNKFKFSEFLLFFQRCGLHATMQTRSDLNEMPAHLCRPSVGTELLSPTGERLFKPIEVCCE